MAGGVARPVPLRPPADGAGPWTFDPDELRGGDHPADADPAAQHPAQPDRQGVHRRRAALLAELAIAHDLLVVTDEVYEHLVFGGAAARLDRRRCPACASARSSSAAPARRSTSTGWKVGWICGPAPLVAAVRTAKQFLTYVNGGPFQPAIAAGLRLPDAYFAHAAARSGVPPRRPGRRA